MIPPDLEQWLSDAGYRHYVFVSYPRAPRTTAHGFARTLAETLRRSLSDYVAVPPCGCVFVDTDCLPPGEEWSPHVQDAVRASVLMAAVCTPVYYRHEHKWCGFEYQAMLTLGRIRNVSALVPIVVRKFPQHPLPAAVSDLQYIDLVDELTLYRNFRQRRHFQTAIDAILRRMTSVAMQLREHDARADSIPGDYSFPSSSAFDGYASPRQPAPLRSLE